jgi:hypothetical protein
MSLRMKNLILNLGEGRHASWNSESTPRHTIVLDSVVQVRFLKQHHLQYIIRKRPAAKEKETQCHTDDKAHNISAVFAPRPQFLRDDASLFRPAEVPAVALSQRNQCG